MIWAVPEARQEIAALRERISMRHAATGDRRSGRIEAHRALVLGLVAETPDITIDELRGLLAGRWLGFGYGTVKRFPIRHNMTRKKKTGHASEQDRPDLQRLHEAFHHGVVVGVAAPSHRADQAVFAEQGPVDLGGVLRVSVRVVDASGWRVTKFDCRRERRERQPRIDPSAERVADDAPRPCIHDRSQIDEAAEDRHVGQIGDPELVRAIATTARPLPS